MASDDESRVSVREGAGLFSLAAVAVFIPVLVVGLGILSLADGGSGPGDAAPAAEVGAGPQVYASRCASCHGASGEGGVGPAMSGVTERIPDLGDQIDIVTNGRNAMPAFGAVLTDEQIEAVVSFEREVLGG